MPLMEPLPAELTDQQEERAAVARARRRLVPYLMLLYVVSFLDRANVSFAKQALATSRGIDEHIYALGAGLFFLSYSTCGFPSNLILHKIGAKTWIPLLMVAWGLASMATMFVDGATSFYLLRLLLGVLEAGFFPGTILYLTYWFPARVRGEIVGLFYLGVPLALMLGGPLSGWLLDMHFAGGLQSWQWMFVIEGSFAVLLGFASFFFLEDRPANASWFRDHEKRALCDALQKEETVRRSAGPSRLLEMLRDLRVMRFLLIYALIQIGIYGTVFYLPAEISALLHRSVGFEVGLVSAIPWMCAFVASYLVPKAADAGGSHRGFAVATLLITGCAGFAFPSLGPAAGVAALSLSAAGFVAVQPLFWTFPTGYLADRAAAGGIALIGAGNLGGFIAPNLKVWADDTFHSPHAGLYLLAGLTLVNACLITTLRPTHRPARP